MFFRIFYFYGPILNWLQVTLILGNYLLTHQTVLIINPYRVWYLHYSDEATEAKELKWLLRHTLGHSKSRIQGLWLPGLYFVPQLACLPWALDTGRGPTAHALHHHLLRQLLWIQPVSLDSPGSCHLITDYHPFRCGVDFQLILIKPSTNRTQMWIASG